MLVKKREFRSRLLGSALPFSYIHIGQHWRAGSRSRWSAVMSSRFSVGQELARHQMEGLAPGTSTELCWKAKWFAFLL